MGDEQLRSGLADLEGFTFSGPRMAMKDAGAGFCFRNYLLPMTQHRDTDAT
jgi:hypothetical protein